MSETQLQTIVNNSGLPESKAKYILDNFTIYFEIAAKWEEIAKQIKVTSEEQTDDMKLARTGRLTLRDKRIEIEKSRKKLKEDVLREGKAIDGIANVLKAVIEPIEKYLDTQEHFVEIQTRLAEEKIQIEIKERMEAERLEKERQEKIEQERIKFENEKLKAEAIEKEKALEIERKKQADILAAEKAKADAEKRELEKQLSDMIECPHCHKKFKLGENK